ncbi:MAG TPA: T9SS type A sorting domain-containing protein, partial [Candidatus Eisenbacteria bacterium]|nr:T9SS type A sorting domain-containing protein [Candidatus Eisenbacteria bacterium]
YCLNEDASYVPGWPVPVIETGANISASPAVGDIDGDGRLEIVVQNSTGWIYGLNHDGTPMAGWPQWIYSNNFFMASPALADFTGDGRLEIVIPSMKGYCYIFDYRGVILPGWPRPYNRGGGPTESSPTIADIDGDGVFDIVLGCEEGVLNAWNFDGDIIPGFPIFLSAFIRGTPTVKDLDLDGDVELVASCWDRNVYVWDLDGSYHRDCSVWNGFHGNIQNTGAADFIQTTDAAVMAVSHRVFEGFVELRYLVSKDYRDWKLLRREPDTEYEMLCAALHPNEEGIMSYVDRAVEEGGVYFYRIEAEGTPGLYLETGEIEVPVAHARLYQNHPNPFNPSTTIPFTVPGPDGGRSAVSLAIYDVRGSRVRTLVEGSFPNGKHAVQWDGRNERGERVSSGVYFARLRVGGADATRKMVLLR